MDDLQSRTIAVQSPIIPAIGALIRDNPGTISLGQGVVYYSPPTAALANLSEFFSDRENHKYKSVRGIPQLLTAITKKLKQENGIEIVAGENCIVVTAGSNMAFMNAILALTNPGDEIILQLPYYFNHEMAITLANCQPILVETDENYQLKPAAIERSITERTKAIVTISPNNPTGAVYSRSALAEVNKICRERGIYHISDEAYEYFTYDRIKHYSPGSCPQSRDRTISLYSLSKAYGFASWRIGYMVIPDRLLDGIKKIQDTLLICPPVISQYAAYQSLEVGISYAKEHLLQINKIREMMLKSLESIADLCTVAPAEGAFYLFLKVNLKIDSFELAKKLIEVDRVAVIPGNTFGMDRGCYLRVAYGAIDLETAKIAMTRLVKGLRAIASREQ
ncbi:MAG: pyridoxal phosphate-dependent aminotransferase [Prochloraceae cyanobacterium]